MSSAMINRNIFTQVNHDSGSLSFATTAIHRFTEAAEYKGLLLDGRGDAVAQFSISVVEKERAESQSQALPAKVTVDLAALRSPASASSTDDCGCQDEVQTGVFRLASGGYAVFRVPAGAAAGYAVELYKAAQSGRGEKVFDSRALDKNDMLAVVLLRPGAYSITNALGGAKAELKVAYPEKIPRLLEPVKVRCGGDKISPAAVRVYPGQGLVFSFDAPSRVKIDLVAPEDRPRTVAARPPPSRVARMGSGTKRSRRLLLNPRRSFSAR